MGLDVPSTVVALRIEQWDFGVGWRFELIDAENISDSASGSMVSSNRHGRTSFAEEAASVRD